MHWKARLRAALAHLTISLLLAGMAAVLVFGLWYAYPYGDLSGGRELFTLLISVDVALGPLLTLFVFNPQKARWKMVLDFVVIGSVQLAALLYGMHTVFQARPVYMVFEYDRYKVVHAVEVDAATLAQAQPAYRELPIWGPKLIALRELQAQDRSPEAILASMAGDDIAFKPEAWRAYDSPARHRALAIAQTLDQLLHIYPDQKEAAQQLTEQQGLPLEQLRYLPVQSRILIWTAVLHPESGQIVGYLPVDGFGS